MIQFLLFLILVFLSPLFTSYLLPTFSSWLILLHSFVFFLSSLIYLFRANFQIYKPITAERLC